MTKNILLVGVGGQGTITASKLLTIGLMKAGYDVKMSEIHGMSQRGGDVSSQVRYGKKVYSPVIPKGEADIIVAFEKMEALRSLSYLKSDGIMVVNDYEMNPMPVVSGYASYSADIVKELKAKANVIDFKAFDAASELGNAKALNVLLLGATVEMMGLTDIDWNTIIKENVKQKFVELNQKAFVKGMELVKGK